MAAPSTATLWGRIAIYNKLITPQQWNQCVQEIRDKGGRVAIDVMLVEKGFMTQEQARQIRHKVQELAAKPHTTPGSAPAPGSIPGSTPGCIEGTASDSSPVRPSPASSQKSPDVSPPSDAAHDDDEDDDGVIPLAGPLPDVRDTHWQPGDADWTSESEPASAAPAHETDPDLAPIEIESLAGQGEDRSHLIIKEESSLRRPTHEGERTLLREVEMARTRASDMIESDVDPSLRIPCEVAPMDMDPGALEVLKQAVAMRASDVHFSSGVKPFVRHNGELKMLDLPALSADQARRIVLGFMDDAQQQRFLKHHDLDFSFEHPQIGRARVNALEQFRGPDVIFRLIPAHVPTLAELGLPGTLAIFTEYTQGLVLVTGPAGCGKSTTAAALIQRINRSRRDHIITVEDPVEFIHQSDRCNVTQRQVPRDTASFATALKGALREDPDVIMIGEMRDLETVSLAIRAAETGHLVIGTLQTRSAARTIDRVIDVFPSDQQATIRTMLSESLRGIISQQLVPRADGKGRVAAIEVLRVSNAVANLIRDAKTFQLQSHMQTGRRHGQKLMDDSLMELVQQKVITRQAAAHVSENPKLFQDDAPAPGPEKTRGRRS